MFFLVLFFFSEYHVTAILLKRTAPELLVRYKALYVKYLYASGWVVKHHYSQTVFTNFYSIFASYLLSEVTVRESEEEALARKAYRLPLLRPSYHYGSLFHPCYNVKYFCHIFRCKRNADKLDPGCAVD
jgi:hypothetical protein